MLFEYRSQAGYRQSPQIGVQHMHLKVTGRDHRLSLQEERACQRQAEECQRLLTCDLDQIPWLERDAHLACLTGQAGPREIARHECCQVGRRQSEHQIALARGRGWRRERRVIRAEEEQRYQPDGQHAAEQSQQERSHWKPASKTVTSWGRGALWRPCFGIGQWAG
jgi:hypothetical protein